MPKSLVVENRVDLIHQARNGSFLLFEQMDKHLDLFPKQKVKEKLFANAQDREIILSVWQSFIDYFSLLEQFENDEPNSELQGSENRELVIVKNLSFVTAYAMALRFIDRVQNNPVLDTVLNEVPSNSLDLKKGGYDALKLKYLNIVIASKFVAYQTIFGSGQDDFPKDVHQGFKTDRDYILKASVGVGTRMTISNAYKVLENFSENAVFPLKRRVASWFGNVKVKRSHTYLISPEEVQSHRGKFKPGDILLQRREWYLSNLGIPGFWTHAALYVGDPSEWGFLSSDMEVTAWAQQNGASNFYELMQKKFSSVFMNGQTGETYARLNVIEAIGHGVVQTALEESAHCDSLAILRPNVTNLDKATAIYRAYGYLGRPYDYRFNFSSDDALVCSELVFKAYIPGQLTKGLSFSSQYVAGSLMVTPNSIAKSYSDEIKSPDKQYELVLFLDGQEKTRNSKIGSREEFATSWVRPKWHVIVQ